MKDGREIVAMMPPEMRENFEAVMEGMERIMAWDAATVQRMMHLTGCSETTAAMLHAVRLLMNEHAQTRDAMIAGSRKTMEHLEKMARPDEPWAE